MFSLSWRIIFIVYIFPVVLDLCIVYIYPNQFRPNIPTVKTQLKVHKPVVSWMNGVTFEPISNRSSILYSRKWKIPCEQNSLP